MKQIIQDVLTFIYSIAHLIGSGIAEIFKFIFPNVEFPQNIIDTLGFLAVLTIFLILVQAAKKIAWIIVITGWILVLIRIFMLLLN
jgi:hypothetical protein